MKTMMSNSKKGNTLKFNMGLNEYDDPDTVGEVTVIFISIFSELNSKTFTLTCSNSYQSQ